MSDEATAPTTPTPTTEPSPTASSDATGGETKQAGPSLDTSGTFASCGRVVHVRSRFYSGPRPALVIDATYGLGRPQFVTLNIDQKDGEGDGKTKTVPLFDPLSDDQRRYVADATAYWAEWMPYQKGQAARTDNAETKLKQAICILAGHADPATQAQVAELLN